MTRIHLKKGREDSLLRRHPWLFSGAISHIEGEPYEGDIVSIISRSGECLGYGPVHTASKPVNQLIDRLFNFTVLHLCCKSAFVLFLSYHCAIHENIRKLDKFY